MTATYEPRIHVLPWSTSIGRLPCYDCRSRVCTAVVRVDERFEIALCDECLRVREIIADYNACDECLRERQAEGVVR